MTKGGKTVGAFEANLEARSIAIARTERRARRVPVGCNSEESTAIAKWLSPIHKRTAEITSWMKAKRRITQNRRFGCRFRQGAPPRRESAKRESRSGAKIVDKAQQIPLLVEITSILVRLLTTFDASAFLALRLAGLKECPTSFASSYEEEVGRVLGDIKKELAGEQGRAVVGCFEGSRLVGIAGLRRELQRKLGHKVLLIRETGSHRPQADIGQKLLRICSLSCLVPLPAGRGACGNKCVHWRTV